jgi:hypothetical protein
VDQIGRKKLQCNESPEAGILGFIHYAHTAFPQLFENSVMADRLAGHLAILEAAGWQVKPKNIRCAS